MVLMLLSAFALLLQAARASTTDCTYHCDALRCPTSHYYEFNASSGNCTRTTVEIDVGKYLLGAVSCLDRPRNTIHDEATCRAFQTNAEQHPGTWHRPSEYFGISFEWDSEYGCRLRGLGDFWGTPQAITTVCLDDAKAWERILPPVGIGMLIGFALAWMSVKGCTISAGSEKRDIVNDRVLGDSTKATEDFKEFWPGSKLLVASANVRGNFNRRWVLLFRIFQVIANAWFPMLVAIFVNGTIVAPLYALYYIIPALCCAGFDLFRQPIYLISPPDCSLFGLDLDQVDQSSHYFWSAVRPYILVATVYILGLAYKQWLPEERQERWFWNGSGFFRASLIEDPGPYCLDFVFWVSILGVFGHTFMTLRLLCYSLRPPTEPVYITLRKNEALMQSVKNQSVLLCEEVSKITCHWDDHFDEDNEDAMEAIEDNVEWRAKLFNDTMKTSSRLDKEVKVEPETQLGLISAICLAAIDLSCYIYKIFVFLRGSSFVLATVIVVALSEALFHLILSGAFCNFRNTVQRTFRARVQTTDFIQWIHWDDGLAGVPYLMVTTIYAFPLQNLDKWYLVVGAIIFICTGTKAMAQFIMQCVDYDMVDVDEDDFALRTLEKIAHGRNLERIVHRERRSILDCLEDHMEEDSPDEEDSDSPREGHSM